MSNRNYPHWYYLKSRKPAILEVVHFLPISWCWHYTDNGHYICWCDLKSEIAVSFTIRTFLSVLWSCSRYLMNDCERRRCWLFKFAITVQPTIRNFLLALWGWLEMKAAWSIVQSLLVLVELSAFWLWRLKCWSNFWLLVSDVKLFGDQKYALFILSLLMTTSEGIGIWWIINWINNRTSVFGTPFCWCEIRTWRCLGGHCLTLIEYIFFCD